MERNDVVVSNDERFITKFYYNSDANQMGENLFKKFNLPDGIVCNINLAKCLYSLVPILTHFNLKFIFTDVFRPVEMQKFLYEHWQERTGQEPKFSLANIETAPHPRGIAVDAVLADENGEKIPLPSSSIKYLPEQRNPDFDDFADTPEEQQKKTNRNFLRTLMLCVGISPINKEWFHFQLPESEKYSAISVEEAQMAVPFEYSEDFEHCKYFDIFHEYQNDEFEGKTRYWINNEKYYSQFRLLEKDEFIEKLEKKIQMNNIFEIVKNFFKTNQFYYDLMMGLGTTFIGFLIVLVVFGRKKIVISDKISVSVNKSRDRKIGEPAWKFKIINKSLFIKFYNFDVKLYGINYITSADNTKTEHKKMIESLAGIRELGCYIPSFILKMIRKKNKDYTINFAYRPLTYSNLMELSKEFEVFELSVFATDSLTGRLHFVKKTFHPAIFVEGDFTNDGNLNEIKSSKIPDEVWKNYKKKQKKENSKMRKIIAAFFIVTAAAVCAFAQSEPMVIITGTSIGDSSNSSDYEKSKKNDTENQKQTEKETVPNSAKQKQSSVKIGDIGPGGGLVFYIEGNRAYECSEVLGERKWSEAITLCREYRGGGYDDWYLPDSDELNYIYQNLRKPGKISGDSWFWSSSEDGYDSYAWLQRFSDGYQSYDGKSNTYSVRAVRAFSY